ncbi:DUF2970 domain-containing protein [Nevskia soli]|uniref:DUF2970 domain-containing protein n=1 Tax=Nevskia soli TaxID=418856 RepID=UPI0004A71DF3|nr:DUF2970 domain-containing protein [Nevskia soli]
MTEPPAEQPGKDERAPTLLQTAASVVSAAFGVQSEKNRERDFKHGKASTFIIGGIVFTLLLIAVLYFAVRLSLKAAGV